MDLHTRPSTPESCHRLLIPVAGYRVTARHCDRSQSLVTLARNLGYSGFWVDEAGRKTGAPPQTPGFSEDGRANEWG